MYICGIWTNSILLGWKERKFAFASGKPIFYEKKVRKKQPKKKISRKLKPIEEKEELDKNKPKPTWCKKESSSASSSPDPANISEENKEGEFKEEEPPRKEE